MRARVFPLRGNNRNGIPCRDDLLGVPMQVRESIVVTEPPINLHSRKREAAGGPAVSSMGGQSLSARVIRCTVHARESVANQDFREASSARK